MVHAMCIRNAVLSDAADLAILATELGYASKADEMRNRLSRVLEQDDQFVAVAILEGTIVGWLQACTSEVLETGFRAEIVGLIVSERSRRRGVGRRLVQSAEHLARARGANTIVVRSNIKRLASHEFYPALGYLPAKTQAVYRKELKGS